MQTLKLTNIRHAGKYNCIVFLTILFMTTCESHVQIQKEYVIVGEINKVLILGNSITVTRPVPEIGWNGHWGMAATSEENDYVHLLIDKFQQYNDSVEVRYASISNFEREFWNYDFSQLDGFRAFAPDAIIIRLGENVDDAEADRRGFDNYLLKLISYIKGNRVVAVVCTSTFWPRKHTNNRIKALADRERYIYVPILDLFEDRSNTAHNKFADAEVGIHPSDKGMKSIADRIAATMGIFSEP